MTLLKVVFVLIAAPLAFQVAFGNIGLSTPEIEKVDIAKDAKEQLTFVEGDLISVEHLITHTKGRVKNYRQMSSLSKDRLLVVAQEELSRLELRKEKLQSKKQKLLSQLSSRGK